MKADRRSLLDEGEAPSAALNDSAARRRQYVAMYRQGQREVLTEAVTWLEGLLQAAADSESKGEDEGEGERGRGQGRERERRLERGRLAGRGGRRVREAVD